MTNKEVVRNFERGTTGKSNNMMSDGCRLWSYNTVVAQWIDGEIVKNNTKYSRTTSKQLSLLNYDKLTTKPAGFGVSDLRDYL